MYCYALVYLMSSLLYHKTSLSEIEAKTAVLYVLLMMRITNFYHQCLLKLKNKLNLHWFGEYNLLSFELSALLCKKLFWDDVLIWLLLHDNEIFCGRKYEFLQNLEFFFKLLLSLSILSARVSHSRLLYTDLVPVNLPSIFLFYYVIRTSSFNLVAQFNVHIDIEDAYDSDFLKSFFFFYFNYWRRSI